MSLARNTLYNVAGALAPLAVTIVTVPLYLAVIGESRYGLLALVWLLLGYVGMFDLGLGTATTHALAREKMADQETQGRILGTSFVAQALLSIGVGLLFFAFAPALLRSDWIHLPGDLSNELFAAIPWLAASIPMVTIGGVLGGVLVAREEFAEVTLISTAGTVLFQLVPLLAAYALGPELSIIIPAAIVARAVPVILFAAAASRRLPLRACRFALDRLKGLFTYGGWTMVTNLVAPILASVDQFVIAAFLGTAAIARYNVGFNLAQRLTVVPAALTYALFPRLSGQLGSEAIDLTIRALRSTTVFMTIACVPAVLLARPFISVWISPDFARDAGPVAEIIVFSIWVNSLAIFPYVLLRAQGRPDLPAKFHLVEIIPFFVALWIGIQWGGLIGAALAWAFRVALDAALLFWKTRLLAQSKSQILTGFAAVLAALAAAELASGSLLVPTMLAVVAGLAAAVWGIRADPILKERFQRFVAVVR